MKKTVYDFQLAVKHAEEWGNPSELSYDLKNAALKLALLKDDDSGILNGMQRTALDACAFLDSIIEKEVEQ